MAGCPDCSGFLKDFLPSLSVHLLPVIKGHIHPKRFQKNIKTIIPFLTELTRIVDTDSYGMLFSLSKETLKQMNPTLQEEKNFDNIHWLQVYFGIHQVIHSVYPSTKSIEDEVITEIRARGILLKHTPPILIAGFWHSLAHAFLTEWKSIHIHHKQYYYLNPSSAICITPTVVHQ